MFSELVQVDFHQSVKEIKRMDLAKELKGLQRKWGSATPRVAGTNLPDGEYVAKIESMVVNRAKKGNGRLQVVTKFEVQGGSEDGRTTSRYDGIEEEESMGYFKGYCEVLGVEIPDDLQELPDVLEDFVDNCQDTFQLTLATRNQFQNINIVGVGDAVEDSGLDPDVMDPEPPQETARERREREKEEAAEAARASRKSATRPHAASRKPAPKAKSRR